MANVFLIPKKLTVIKSLNDARLVIDETNESNVLYVEVEGGQYIKFVKSGENKVIVTDIKENSNPFNTIEIVVDIQDAVKTLYQNRKRFNAKWKD